MEALALQKRQFSVLIDQYLIPDFQRRIDQQLVFLGKVRTLQESFVKRNKENEGKTAQLKRAKTYKQALQKLIKSDFQQDFSGDFDAQFGAFSTAVNQYLQSLDLWTVRPQDQARFETQAEDSQIVKTGKTVKRGGYYLAKLPERVLNRIGQTKQPLKPWTQKIASRQLTHYYLKEQFSQQLVPLLFRLNQSICMTMVLPKQIDEAINAVVQAKQEGLEESPALSPMIAQLGQSMTELEAEKESLKEKIRHRFEAEYEAFSQAFFKAGTFELSNRRFRKSRIAQLHRKTNQQTASLENEWTNTRQVLINDWHIEIDLYTLMFSVLEEYQTVDAYIKKEFEVPVLNQLQDIEKVFTTATENIQSVSAPGDLQKTIGQERSVVQSSLVAKMLPTANEYILARELPLLINRIELSIEENINGLTTRAGVVKGLDFTQPKPIKAGAINYISPVELISFESRPQVLKVTQQVKTRIFELVSRLRNAIVDLGQICEFSLESALAAFGGEAKEQDPGKIALEGIERTKERLEEIRKMVNEVNQVMEEELFPALQKFNQHLTRFTDIDTVLELRVRVVKAKALEKSRKLRKQVIQTVTHFIPVLIDLIKNNYQKGSAFVKQSYQKFGIVAPPEVISTELADFLLETQQAVSNLPFVYKRLFSTEPLTDASFFLHRNQELQSLNRAYNNWTKGRFATTLVVGEKGCGATSLLNFFLKDLATSCEVFRFRVDRSIHSQEGLYQFLNARFDKELGSMAEWVEYLNAGQKKIVVLEDIHRLFLRKVNGFAALKELTQLISHCETHTFWVLSCTQYAFHYLDKTQLFSEQFNYLISLEVFDDESIMNMIKQRHKVSGYKIRYAMSPLDLNSKKLKKLSEEEQQIQLQKEYFAYLNKIARGNIFLMLTYWVRSVEKIAEGTIFITSLKRYDLSFLKSISVERVFALCVLILHERLTEEEYGLTLQINPVKARSVLVPMLEAGILILENGQYSVNPLLYRQTTTLLKSRNLIY